MSGLSEMVEPAPSKTVSLGFMTGLQVQARNLRNRLILKDPMKTKSYAGALSPHNALTSLKFLKTKGYLRRLIANLSLNPKCC